MRAVLLGVATAFAITLVLSILLAVFISSTDVAISTLAGVLYWCGILAVFASGFVAGRQAGAGAKGWLHGGLTGAGYVSASVAVGALLYPGTGLAAGLAGKLATAFLVGALGGQLAQVRRSTLGHTIGGVREGSDN